MSVVSYMKVGIPAKGRVFKNYHNLPFPSISVSVDALYRDIKTEAYFVLNTANALSRQFSLHSR